MDRSALHTFLPADEPVLEIGPLDSPFLSKDTHNVFFADIQSKDDIYRNYLRDGALYENLGYSTKEDLYNALTPIDFVVTHSYLDAVGDRRFQAVFSSHVIEHTSDIITHLLQLSECLVEGGSLVLCIPDKRHCGDYFREVTPFRDALDVYLHGPAHGARLAFDSMFNGHPTNSAVFYHHSLVSFQDVIADEARYPAAMAHYSDVWKGENSSVHIWVFTQTSFLAFLRDGLRSKLLPYTLLYTAASEADSPEFHVVLQKNTKILLDDTKRLQEIFRLQSLIDQTEGCCPHEKLTSVKAFCQGTKHLYIYGAGPNGGFFFTQLMRWGISCQGFITSRGYKKASSHMGVPVYEIDDPFPGKDDCRIIVTIQNDAAVVGKALHALRLPHLFLFPTEKKNSSL